MRMKCHARQYSDQMNCGRCGLVWDMNDPNRPRCGLRPTRPGWRIRLALWLAPELRPAPSSPPAPEPEPDDTLGLPDIPAHRRKYSD